MLRFFQKIALNPFFQALVVAGLLILFVPMGINKYRCDQVELSTSFDGTQFVFADLDHDGVSERIQTFYNRAENAGIALRKDIFTIGQWNFKGVYEKFSPRLMLGDYDSNSKDEIYIFTQVNDSIMLHILEYDDEPKLIMQDRLIAILGENLMDPDFVIFPGQVTDMNGDGSGDLVFAVNAGHSRQPRCIMIYDVLNDSLIQSPFFGAQVNRFYMENLDLDPFPEFYLHTYAAANYNKEPVAYSDTSSWLIALDHDLEFLFPPLEFPGPTGGLQATVIETAAGVKRFMSVAVFGSPVPDTAMLFLADLKGNRIREKKYESSSIYALIGMVPPIPGMPRNKAYGVVEHYGFLEIDSLLDVKQVNDVAFAQRNMDFLDIDLDGEQEFILLHTDQQKHQILRNDFSHSVDLDMPIQSDKLLLSVKLNGNDPPQLSVQGDQRWKLFEYKTNLVYRFRFLVWLGIYLAVLLFILGIRKLYGIQLKRRYETEKQMTRLQLTGIKAQMEPHFIMNTINMIGSSIYRQKAEEAYQQLLNFSGMVRSLLISSDKLTRSLAEELDFVDSYLQLEKSRFAGQFDFSIRRLDEEEEEKIIIPKMVVQIHAENALKHGLLPRKEGGLLEISVEKGRDYLVITVRDNGIGRHAAAHRRSESTGKGMKIIDQLFETYNKHNRTPLRQEITDLRDANGQPSGTLVKIFVPLEFNAEIY